MQTPFGGAVHVGRDSRRAIHYRHRLLIRHGSLHVDEIYEAIKKRYHNLDSHTLLGPICA